MICTKGDWSYTFRESSSYRKRAKAASTFVNVNDLLEFIRKYVHKLYYWKYDGHERSQQITDHILSMKAKAARMQKQSISIGYITESMTYTTGLWPDIFCELAGYRVFSVHVSKGYLNFSIPLNWHWSLRKFKRSLLSWTESQFSSQHESSVLFSVHECAFFHILWTQQVCAFSWTKGMRVLHGFIIN